MADKTMKLITGVKTVDGKQELEYTTYPYPLHVKGSLIIKAIDLASTLEKTEENINSKMITDLADFVVEVYAKQFTRDELIDGLQAHEVIETLTGVLQFVIAGNQKLGENKEFIQKKTS